MGLGGGLAADFGECGPFRAAIPECQGRRAANPLPVRRIGLFRRGNTGKPCATAFELGRAMIELLQFIVHMIAELLYRLTEPALRPIRNLLPNMGGIDISPIILFLIILFIQSVILPNIAKLFI
jgi:uncharacterized protein YggT (Ycf19 family)